jgi:hypothetical protein
LLSFLACSLSVLVLALLTATVLNYIKSNHVIQSHLTNRFILAYIGLYWLISALIGLYWLILAYIGSYRLISAYIGAGMQGVENPCPRVEHPVWLTRRMSEKASGRRQMSIKSMFGRP